MDAFREVDERVGKPVLGSDGSSRWQEFQKTSVIGSKRVSVAPLAPQKAADRASGLKSWEDERKLENENRQKLGLSSLEEREGYTHFKMKNDDKNDDGVSGKERKRIVSRTRPDDKEYYLPCSTFEGWRWDYIFTTRDEYGTGYYWDGWDSFLELQGKRKRPDQMLASKRKQPSNNNNSDTNENPETSETKKSKTSKSIITPVLATVPSESNHPLEQVMVALHRQQQQPPPQLSSLLPPGWQAAKDTASNKTYYYHVNTGHRTWDKPASLPQGWMETTDPATNRLYYYHSETGQTSWDRPGKT